MRPACKAGVLWVLSQRLQTAVPAVPERTERTEIATNNRQTPGPLYAGFGCERQYQATTTTKPNQTIMNISLTQTTTKIIKKVPLSNLRVGDTVNYNGELRTVGKTDVKHSAFMRYSFLGDASIKSIERVIFVVPTACGVRYE
jgi:hypothetical protein